jgi:hypothetical protein
MSPPPLKRNAPPRGSTGTAQHFDQHVDFASNVEQDDDRARLDG